MSRRTGPRSAVLMVRHQPAQVTFIVDDLMAEAMVYLMQHSAWTPKAVDEATVRDAAARMLWTLGIVPVDDEGRVYEPR